MLNGWESTNIQFNQLLLNDDSKKLIPMITNCIPGKIPSFMSFIFHFILLLKYIGKVSEREKCALIFLNYIIRDSEQLNKKKNTLFINSFNGPLSSA